MTRFATLFPDYVEKLVLIDIHPKKERYYEQDKPNVVQLMSRHFKKSIETVKSEGLEQDAAKKRLNELLETGVKVRDYNLILE